MKELNKFKISTFDPSTNNARISGVVEETPNKLEYEVALYKEAPPIGRIGGIPGMSAHLKNHTKQQQAILNQSELPVDQAVPIGTKLQLRARISQQSVWKFVKLMEVTVSIVNSSTVNHQLIFF